MLSWLAFLLLEFFLFEVPVSSALVPTHSNCENLRKESGVQAAIDYWKECNNECHPIYFENTAEKLKNMDLSNWYNTTITNLFEDNPEDFKNKSEASLFGAFVSGENGFECNIADKTCTKQPSCEKIVKHLEAYQKELSPEELMDESRKATFALDTIVALNKVATTIFVRRNSIASFILLILCRT
jgi:hypothetical protein